MRFLVILLISLCYSCSPKNETIKIKGSDTEVNLAVLLAEQFHTANNEVLVSVSGGGSGLGVASLLNGNADIANSSREMKKEELLLFQKKNTFSFVPLIKSYNIILFLNVSHTKIFLFFNI